MAEVSLAAGGVFEVFDWGGDKPALSVDIPPGGVRLRACWRGLVANRFECLDEDGESDERLLLQVWPATTEPPTVLRRWAHWPS